MGCPKSPDSKLEGRLTSSSLGGRAPAALTTALVTVLRHGLVTCLPWVLAPAAALTRGDGKWLGLDRLLLRQGVSSQAGLLEFKSH